MMDVAGLVHAEDGLIDPIPDVDMPEAPPQQQLAPQQAPLQVAGPGPQVNVQPQAQPRIVRIQVSNITGVGEAKEILDTNIKNWSSWSQSMYLLLRIIKAVPYIEGKIKPPNEQIDLDSANDWDYNDSYIMILISNNIALSEKIHMRGCQTAHHMWKNLRNIHHIVSIQVQTNRIRILKDIKAKEGDNIPSHLVRLKDQWDQITYFGIQEFRQCCDDNFFKMKIATSLPSSWDTFTAPYCM